MDHQSIDRSIRGNLVLGPEGYGPEKFVSKEGDNVFDDFYVDYYDDLTHDHYKNTFEIKEILRATKQEPSKITVLDVGCGTGHHCKQLAKQGAKVYGIDKSNAMITRAKSLHSSHDIDFRTACALDSITFPPNSFDLIQSLYFTVILYSDSTAHQTSFQTSKINNDKIWMHCGSKNCIELQ